MSSTDLIKERVNIADVVGGYVKLERAGANFRARCPFHTEKTPSFFVSPSRGTFHCFGCNKGGDVFTFVQDIEGLDFMGALKMLAERAGVELPRFTKKEATEEEELRTILEATTIFFQRNLAGAPARAVHAGGNEPVAYLYGRGLTKKSLENFRLGFAPAGFENLKNYLTGKGFSEARAERAGVLVRGARGYHDRFRSRIMFPLFDSVGRVVGFTGRIFGNDDGMGKYVNTPETLLYHKSHVLYGYDHAKTAIRERGSAVLVEGQMDLIAAHQMGIGNAVAVSGTAFSDHHAAMLARLANTLTLALDADAAGRKAAVRAAGIAYMKGLDVLLADIPDGKDPADMLKDAPASFSDIVSRAEPAVRVLLRRIQKSAADTRAFRREAGEIVIPLLAAMDNKIDQAHFAGEMADTLGIPEESVWEEVMRAKKNAAFSLPKNGVSEREEKKHEMSRKDALVRHIESFLLWQGKEHAGTQALTDARVRFEALTGRAPSEDEAPERAFEAELYFEGKDARQELAGMFRELEKEILKERLTRATEALRGAEVAGERREVESLLAECAAISKEMAKIDLKA